ncbi:hypothetical protein BD310DRAFT_934991 [Dichomitus squalens]|uniref:Uncharacterized protein n=1 Tax=Dichomitus squalens TaxID=114155 RepID=A0A4Q9PKZ2_9APHY|nr:hypothetical protein BD310DRAFT_934991 [Dichomitus squalens]
MSTVTEDERGNRCIGSHDELQRCHIQAYLESCPRTYCCSSSPLSHTCPSSLYRRLTVRRSSSSIPPFLSISCVKAAFHRLDDLMRVLDTHSGQFVQADLQSITSAILSHTWDREKAGCQFS